MTRQTLSFIALFHPATESRAVQSSLLMPKKILAATLATLVLGGCAIHPRPLTLDQRRATLQSDAQAMFAEQAPVTGPITLE